MSEQLEERRTEQQGVQAPRRYKAIVAAPFIHRLPPKKKIVVLSDDENPPDRAG